MTVADPQLELNLAVVASSPPAPRHRRWHPATVAELDAMTDDELEDEFDHLFGVEKEHRTAKKARAITRRTTAELYDVWAELHALGKPESWIGEMVTVLTGEYARFESLTQAQGEHVLASLRYDLEREET